ncbi:hypothetical protein HK100_011820 [Physocladia obscura]|uniref:Uncharacterized protein n=1 Tax=Physocladia obscura TaxID=109957 RepID=A0AAD5T6P3_9FUNG|nr:hypothetical protein HK100_011820 [Physocladia obscura]
MEASVADLRDCVGSLQRRQHHSGMFIERHLRTCSEDDFGDAVGVTRAAFYAFAVEIAPLLSVNTSSLSSSSSSSSSACFTLPVDSQLAIFLIHLRRFQAQSHPLEISNENTNSNGSDVSSFGYFDARIPIVDPLRANILRSVACALQAVFYSPATTSLCHPNVALVALFQCVYGSSFTKLYASLPKERAVLADASVANLLQLDLSSIPQRLVPSSGPNAPVPERFRWSPSFLAHPVFDEHGLINMHHSDKNAALANEMEILSYFVSVLEQRFKIVRFTIPPYSGDENFWFRRFNGLPKDVFAYLLAKLTPALSHDETFKLPDRSRSLIDVLLINEFSNSISRDEVIAIVMQVRGGLLAAIFSNASQHDTFALAFQTVFGKFSFLYDMIPVRLGIPEADYNSQQSQQAQVPTGSSGSVNVNISRNISRNVRDTSNGCGGGDDGTSSTVTAKTTTINSNNNKRQKTCADVDTHEHTNSSRTAIKVRQTKSPDTGTKTAATTPSASTTATVITTTVQRKSNIPSLAPLPVPTIITTATATTIATITSAAPKKRNPLQPIPQTVPPPVTKRSSKSAVPMTRQRTSTVAPSFSSPENSDMLLPVPPRRRATFGGIGNNQKTNKRSYAESNGSSSPPSAIKDIRNWRSLLARPDEIIELDGCEPIIMANLAKKVNNIGGLSSGSSGAILGGWNPNEFDDDEQDDDDDDDNVDTVRGNRYERMDDVVFGGEGEYELEDGEEEEDEEEEEEEEDELEESWASSTT